MKLFILFFLTSTFSTLKGIVEAADGLQQAEVCIDDESCKNGGECVTTANPVFCRCQKGWKGDLCSLPDCSSSGLCVPAAKCVEKYNRAVCVCEYNDESGVTKYFEDCTGKSSYPKGECFTNIEGLSLCVCVDGWTGQNCEIQKCQDQSYCDNGGFCIYVDGVRTCDCPKGTYGTKCKKCDLNCNHGVCLYENSKDIFYCECENNYSLPDCSQLGIGPKNLCVGSYCNNNGECTIVNSIATCECMNGYIGDVCQYRCDTYCESKTCIDENNERSCQPNQTMTIYSLSVNSKIGIGIGVGIVGVALISIVTWVFVKRDK